MWHFMILGFHERYSAFGISKGQATMQNLHPRHLSPFQVTGPSLVLNIAFTRHIATQAACQQCMHCLLTNTSPFSVLKRLTTVYCFSLVSLTCASALSVCTSGTKFPFATEQATSQDLHPIHLVVSTSTPLNSLGSFAFSAAKLLAGMPPAATVAEVMKICLLSMICPIQSLIICRISLIKAFSSLNDIFHNPCSRPYQYLLGD